MSLKLSLLFKNFAPKLCRDFIFFPMCASNPILHDFIATIIWSKNYKFCHFLGQVDTWPLKMGPIASPETLVLNQLMLCNIPEDGIIQVNRSKSLHSCKNYKMCNIYHTDIFSYSHNKHSLWHLVCSDEAYAFFCKYTAESRHWIFHVTTTVMYSDRFNLYFPTKPYLFSKSINFSRSVGAKTYKFTNSSLKE